MNSYQQDHGGNCGFSHLDTVVQHGQRYKLKQLHKTCGTIKYVHQNTYSTAQHVQHVNQPTVLCSIPIM